MGKSDNESIAASLRRATEAPDDTGGASAPLPQLFNPFPIPPGADVVDDEPPPNNDKRRVGGVTKYKMEAHIRRFIMGQETVGTNDRGQPETAERDDSQEYEALLNQLLNAEGVLRWEEKQHLRDGTLVISVCYLTKKDEPQPAGEKNEPLYDTQS